MKNANFDWAPFYEEFAEKLLDYKDNRESLVSKVKAAFDNVEKLDLPKLDDEGEFDDIDPFTVFSLFNRGLTDDNRQDIISQLKALFDVKAEVPSSFDGIPIANAINAAFYDFKSHERKANAIDNIWKLFEATLNLAKEDNAQTRENFAKFFDIVLAQPRIARSKLTVAMFWVAPKQMLNLDNLTTHYIYSSGMISPELVAKLPKAERDISAAYYLKIRDEIGSYINSNECEYGNFMEFSHAAYVYTLEKGYLSEFTRRFIKEYPIEKENKFAGNDFGKYIRTTVKNNIANIIDDENYIVKGSVGQGNWAGVPWVAIFDKDVTDSAQKGEYIVYLLSADEETLYLTFNQGCTELASQHGKTKAIEIMREKVADVRARVDGRGFSTDPIDLASPGDDKALMYEEGTYFSKAYKVYAIPDEEELRDDLMKMLEIYEDVKEGVGSKRPAWLLTWNSGKWNWDNYEEACKNTQRGETELEPWTCVSKQPKIGDDVYLMKTGDQPRGIIAHGKVAKESYLKPRFDDEDKEVKYIDVAFDYIADHKSGNMISQDELNEKIPEQTWSPMGSGIEIKEPGLSILKEMWKKLVNGDSEENEMSNTKFDKNLILYGPPGTGKTYNSAIYAVAICDGKSIEELSDYDAAMDRYRELRAEGRIAFTTFHQSYGYEEFIEGIKPVMDDDISSDVRYHIEPGVFKRFCEKAGAKDIKVSLGSDGIEGEFNSKVWHVLLDGTGRSELKERCFEEGTIRIGWDWVPAIVGNEYEGLSQDAIDILHFFQDDMQVGDFVMTCKNLKTIDAVGIITGEYEYDDSDKEFPRKRTVKWLETNLNIDIPEINSGKQLNRDTVFPAKRITGEMLLDKIRPKDISVDSEEKNHVFIIDEINRGNISKIFGELITLIESTKRAGEPEAMEAILPYSGDRFSVPSNVYILGTMNTADRSIALMDTALRRRFSFIEMMPSADVLRSIGADTVTDGTETLDVARMLEVINERIEYLFDREHTIGHAFFTGLKNNNSVQNLAAIFKKSIIPLLQEYFYEDYNKIQLVLGDNDKTDPTRKFILDIKTDQRSLFNGNPDVDLPENKYVIQEKAFEDINSYKEISKEL